MRSVLFGLMLVGPTTSSTWHYDLQDALSGKIPAHSCACACWEGPTAAIVLQSIGEGCSEPYAPNGGTCDVSHSRTASPTPANVAGRIGRCPLSGSSPACIGGASIHLTPPRLPTEHPQSPEMLQRYVISSLSGTRGPNPRGLHRERDEGGGA